MSPNSSGLNKVKLLDKLHLDEDLQKIKVKLDIQKEALGISLNSLLW